MDPVNTTTSAITDFLNRRLVEHTDILEMAYINNRSDSTSSDGTNEDNENTEKTSNVKVSLLDI